MNDITSMNNTGLMALLGANADMPGMQNLETTPQVVPGEGFQDLLGLVSDMQVADGQAPEQDDFLLEEASRLKFPGQNGLDIARNAAQIQMLGQEVGTAPRMDVGQPALKVSGAETIGAQEVLTSKMDLGLQAQRQLIQSAHTTPDGVAVAAWSSALAAGEVTAVELQATPASEVLATRRPTENAVLPSSLALTARATALPEVASELGKTPAASVSKTVSQIAAVRNDAPLSPIAEVAPVSAPVAGLATAKATSATAVQPNSIPEGVVQEARQMPTATQTSRVASESSAEVSIPSVRSAPKSSIRTGQDMLLDRMDVSVEASKQGVNAANLRAPALVGAAAMAAPESDRRISSESVSFVAEKIETLRAQGGGQLRVELNPNGMGSIEIRVSMVRGQVQVKLAAERPETLKALQESRGDLLGRLESHQAAATLEMSTLSEVRGQAMRSFAPQHALSESLVDLRSASAERRAPEVQGSDSRDNFASGDWQRDERREQSRDRWSETFERQSA